MPLEWTTLAQNDLVAIHTHIAHTDARAAFRVVHTIHHVARIQLTTAPLSGRPGRILHTRELVISQLPYIVAYRVHDGTVQILRVLHTSLRWSDTLHS